MTFHISSPPLMEAGGMLHPHFALDMVSEAEQPFSGKSSWPWSNSNAGKCWVLGIDIFPQVPEALFNFYWSVFSMLFSLENSIKLFSRLLILSSVISTLLLNPDR